MFMLEIKNAGLWKVTDAAAKLATKKGKWVVGQKSMKASEHYPEFFGEAIAMVFLRLTTELIVDRLSEDILASLASPTDKVGDNPVPPSEPLQPQEVGDNGVPPSEPLQPPEVGDNGVPPSEPLQPQDGGNGIQAGNAIVVMQKRTMSLQKHMSMN